MNRKPGYGAQLRANLDPTKGVGRLRQQGGGHGSRNPLRRGRGGRCKTLGASPSGAAVSADLSGSSKYSNENFEGRRGERFHVNGTCTWDVRRRRRGPREELSFLFNSLSTLETAQPEIGSSGWKSTARPVVSGLQGEQPQPRTRRLSANCSSCSRGESGSSRAGWGIDWERLPRKPSPCGQQSTQNCETTAKGTGLAESAGKEDPVELDSISTL
ncbi:Unknown protein [Striga hermonthica]|uniref:Uncharacterized protein n=1 Tax=Striga hermonthica TaxID=68872 RepID=A0A9N7NCF7_STRHE|nr:Unknown protein [Striga hermonthica]